jgi:hypothetical protein
VNMLKKGLLAGTAFGVTATAQAGVQISDMELHAYGWMPTTYAYYHLSTSGDIYTNSDVWDDYSSVDAGDWLSPKSGMSDYQVRFSNPQYSCQGAFNTWINLSGPAVAMVYVAAQYENFNAFCSFTVEIRATANPSVILDSAYIWLNANTGV